MSENDPDRSSRPGAAPGLPQPEASTGAPAGELAEGEGPGGVRGLFRQLRAFGRDVASVTLGKLIEPPHEPEGTQSRPVPPAEASPETDWRVSTLHAAAERLRGAADSYIAAKLDEIEARVDAKLDHVERRIDAKIVELHEQLQQMRDRELRHRLRLLKITLVFTVLVAAVSLVYKWLARYLAG